MHKYLVTALFLFASTGFAQTLHQPTAYSSFGYSSLSFTEDNNVFRSIIEQELNLGTVTSLSYDLSEEGYRIKEGFILGKYTTLEGALTYYGDSTVAATLEDASVSTIELEQYSFDLMYVGRYQFMKVLTAHASIGGMFWHNDVSVVGSDVDYDNQSLNLSWGLGLSADISDTMMVSLDYLDSSIDDIDVTLTTLSIGFRY